MDLVSIVYEKCMMNMSCEDLVGVSYIDLVGVSREDLVGVSYIDLAGVPLRIWWV